MEKVIKKIIHFVGDDPNRLGLVKTPSRVLGCYREFYFGYLKRIARFVKSFNSKFEDGLICVKDIFFCSHCEHHMQPFFGKLSVAYIPNENLIGLSKIVEIINFYSATLQTQERLTSQILNKIRLSVLPKCVAVKTNCKHMCMVARGVKSVCTSTNIILYSGMARISINVRRLLYDWLK